MTAVALIRTTRYERALLAISAHLEHVATSRAERRAHRRPPAVSYRDARADAQARGNLGILPR